MSAVLAPRASARFPSEIDVLDLFAGAGGSDEALIQVAEEMGIHVRGHWIVNHWDRACETQRANHRHATVIEDAVERVAIEVVAPGRNLDLLLAAPPCTHFSKARGGKPRDDQQRATVEYVLRFMDEKRPVRVIVENVPDFVSWGPVDAEGKVIRERKGEYFAWFLNELRRRGYEVDWKLLNAADFGDRTTRTRFFLIARCDGKPIRFPRPPHSKGGKVPGTLTHRPARDVLDLTLEGEDIWARRRPLAISTWGRIAYGFERKGPMWKPIVDSMRAYIRAFEPVFAAGVEQLRAAGLDEKRAESLASVEAHLIARRAPGTGPVPIVKLLEAATSVEDVKAFLLHLEEFSLVTSMDRPVTNRSLAKNVDEAMPTTTGNDRIAVVQPVMTLGQHGGSVARDAGEPFATLAAGGAIQAILASLVLPWEGPARGNLARDIEEAFQCFTSRGGGHLVTAVLELAQGAVITPGHAERPGEDGKPGQAPRSMDPALQPFWTMAENGAGLLALSHFVMEYFTNGTTRGIDVPLGVATTRDRLALITSVLRNGLVSIRTRMLAVKELAGGMSFPPDYWFAGNETEQKKQIGNAWAVEVGKALIRAVLTDDENEPMVRVTPTTAKPPTQVSPTTGVRVHKARRATRVTTQSSLITPVAVSA